MAMVGLNAPSALGGGGGDGGGLGGGGGGGGGLGGSVGGGGDGAMLATIAITGGEMSETWTPNAADSVAGVKPLMTDSAAVTDTPSLGTIVAVTTMPPPALSSSSATSSS